MKILAAITVVALILALAWTQNRTIQNSNGTSPADQGLVEATVDQQNQEKQTSTAKRSVGVRRSSNSPVQPGNTRSYNPSPAQRSAQTRQEQQRYNHSVASRNSPGGAPYNQQPKRPEQHAGQQRQDYEQRYAEQRASSEQRQRAYTDHPYSRVAPSTTRPPQEPTSGRQGIAYQDVPGHSAVSYDQNTGSPTYRTSSPGYQTAAVTRGPGAYNQPVDQPTVRQPQPRPTQEIQAPSHAQSQQSVSEPPVDQPGYGKDGESENCIYRDGKIYCR